MSRAVLMPTSMADATPCPWCTAWAGERCRTARGDAARGTHNARWKAAIRMAKSRQMWHVIRRDDPRFGLVAGDIVRTVNYPYDAKVSVLFREWDGFEPECNQYTHDVAFLGFVPLDQESR